MFVNLAREEQALLVAMVEARLRELHPEIRRSRRVYRSNLRQEREVLERCLEHLGQSVEARVAVPVSQEAFDPEI